jgi:penicillin-insensitive murein endopeptidase
MIRQPFPDLQSHVSSKEDALPAQARQCCCGVWSARMLKTARLLTCIGCSSAFAFLSGNAAFAQDVGTLNPEPLPPISHPESPKTLAKEVFGREKGPAHIEARSIGFYAKGCLAGATALPINGSTWQVMRLSRNRNWGHPKLVDFLERLASQAPKTGWTGLLVGDMSQPRGGPMLGGHASHQVGLDADIWLTPMPNRELTREER